jgi:hypothetical protein
MAAESQDDLLEAIGIASALRITADQHTAPARSSSIMDHYIRLWARFRHLESVAQALISPALSQALEDANRVLYLIRSDPASPGLEEAFRNMQNELALYAAIFAGDSDTASDEYRNLCRMITTSQQAAEPIALVWSLMRRERFAARGAPPQRRANSAPQADETEYYM